MVAGEIKVPKSKIQGWIALFRPIFNFLLKMGRVRVNVIKLSRRFVASKESRMITNDFFPPKGSKRTNRFQGSSKELKETAQKTVRPEALKQPHQRTFQTRKRIRQVDLIPGRGFQALLVHLSLNGLKEGGG